MNQIKLIILLSALIVVGCNHQNNLVKKNRTKNELLKTTKFQGKYAFGDNIEKGPVGSISIFPETDTTLLFYLDISRGAPSYNLGQLYGRLNLKNGQGIYVSKEDYQEKGCKLKMIFKNKYVLIRTIDECYECPFGHGVVAGNRYEKKSNVLPTYFVDGHGQKIYFMKTKPENYLK